MIRYCEGVCIIVEYSTISRSKKQFLTFFCQAVSTSGKCKCKNNCRIRKVFQLECVIIHLNDFVVLSAGKSAYVVVSTGIILDNLVLGKTMVQYLYTVICIIYRIGHRGRKTYRAVIKFKPMGTLWRCKGNTNILTCPAYELKGIS